MEDNAAKSILNQKVVVKFVVDVEFCVVDVGELVVELMMEEKVVLGAYVVI